MKQHHVDRPGRRIWRSGALLVVAALGAAAALLLGGSQRAAGAPATTTSCPTTNAPNELVLGGGSPQTSKLESPFSTPLQVTIDNSNGCAVTTSLAGTAVTFTAPTSGATGTFASSGSNTVTVGADGQGNASAGFSANDVAGTYTVVASSAYGTVDFTLTNTASGIGATITPQAPLDRAAASGAAYAAPLQVVVLDANGNLVEGASVSFSLGSSGGGGASGGSGSQTPAATFDGGSSTAMETTNAEGVATSPKFTANGVAGAFSATASTAGITEPATFNLYNLPGKAPSVKLVGASRRSATAGDRYAKPLAVVVRSASGQPLEGLTITFTLGSGGGGGGATGASSAGASFIGGSSQVTATTGARGRATSPFFMADSTAGTFDAFAIVPGVAAPIEITLDNLAASPPTVDLLGGAARSATVDERYRRPLEVKVLGAGGVPDQGVTVTFALGSSGAGGSGAGGSASAGASFLGGSAQAAATTGANGIATSPLFTADDTAGAFTATASVPGVTNPASFSLDNLAGKPPAIRPHTADDAAATVGDHYTKPLEVRVLGGDGKPVQGASVTFTLGSAGGGGGASGASGAGASFFGGSASSTVTTDAAGTAVSPAFVANTVAGTFLATATLSGSTQVASFALDNLAGKPDSLTAGAAASEEAKVGSVFPIRLAVTVEDVHSNPVAGALVTFRAPAGGASGRFAHARTVRVRTNKDGIAVAPAFVANRTAGGYAVTASVAGVAPAAFALVNDPAGQNG